jgi:hypothetical protein
MRSFISRFLFAFLLIFVAFVAQAQSATNTSKFAWDIQASSPAVAQALTYRLYLDGGSTSVVVPGVTCVAGVAPNQACTGGMPSSITVGNHTATLASFDGTNESATRSNIVTFSFVTLPNPPSNLRIIP